MLICLFDRLVWETKSNVKKIEAVDMSMDKRLWYAVGAVILLILIGLYSGFFDSGGEPEVTPTEQESPAQTQ